MGPLYGFVLTVLMVPPLRGLRRLLDIPGGRKQHGVPVPLVGGLAIFLGAAWGFEASQQMDSNWSMFLLACALLVMVGALDDVFDLRPSLKFLTQVTAALVMTVGAGHTIHVLGEPFFTGPVGTGVLAIPFTLLVALTVINAYNMIDGIDGLGAGVSLVALGGMAVLAGVFGLYPEQEFLHVLIACIAGFLLYNLPLGVNAKLRTFMGDSGSMFLGLAVVWFGIVLTQGEHGVASAVSLLWFAALPVYDLIATCVDRVLQGRRVWLAGTDHVHYLLIREGLSARKTLAAILLTQVVFTGIGLTGPLLGVSDGVLFTGWCLVGAGHFFFARRRRLIAIIWAKLLKMF